MQKVFSQQEVAAHNTAESCWIIVSGGVYDVTSFLNEHPGGKKVLLKEAGKDATKKFNLFHKPTVLDKYGPGLLVGYLEGHAPASKSGTDAFDPVKFLANIKPDAPFSDQLEYCEPAWYGRLNSPYYTDSHRKYRHLVRAFVDKEIAPYAHDWDEQYKLPKELFKKCYEWGLLPGVVGPPWPEKYAGKCPVDDFDAFHELILVDEISRCGAGGVIWGLIEGLQIGLPPVMNFASDYLKDKVVADCLRGDKFICLNISEPQTGSDVANLYTTARKEGDFYILNGEKKWITNGTFADYFTVAVRTGGPGHHGLSFLLVERDMPGVSTRHMKCMGVWSSGTAFVTFDDVKVPACNLIGKENEGFKYIMYNFNHERWGFCVQATRLARVCAEEAFKYANKRETFGKHLMDHQMIRGKFAEMFRMVESCSTWVESLTYQMKTMSKKEQNAKLGGQIALCKVHCSKTMEFCAREAAQIFGGASYVRGGVGEKIERIYREVRAYAIPGGSEEVLSDFAVRQAVKAALAKEKAKL